MRNKMIATGVSLLGLGIAGMGLLAKALYDAGCQKGVDTSKWLVMTYEPEAYDRLCDVIKNGTEKD